MPIAMGALGGAWLGSENGARERPTSRRQATLFALLLLNRGHTVSFDVLVDAMWPDSTATAASNRNSLRVHMSNLRRWVRDVACEEAAARFETRGDGYSLAIEAQEFDVFAFEDAVATGQHELLEGNHSKANSALRSALDIWAEPFPELADHESAEPERIRLEELHELAQDELIESEIQLGHSADVIGRLEARLVTHPFRERSYGQLMKALYLVGRQADALAVYQRARRCLLDELGLEPGQALREIESEILGQTLRIGAGRPAPNAPDDGPSTGLFVGRDAELTAAVRALDQHAFVIVRGEAGIGKTRFVRELARAAADRTWIWTRSSSDRSAPPMWSILQPLGLLAEPVEDSVSEFERNFRLAQELQNRGSQVVLVLDDFHWADEATVRFVRQLAEYDTSSLVTVVCMRTAPAYLDTEAGAAVLDLGRSGAGHQVILGALDADATAALVESHPSGGDRGRELHERSAGNPLFLTELLSAGDAAADVPPMITNVVRSRLHDADETITTALATAAVIDDEIDPSLVLRAANFSAAEVVAAIEYGHSMGLIATSETGQRVFAHSLLRESLATLLSSNETCVVHDRVATEIENRFETSEHAQYRVAHHAFHALPLGSALRATRASSAAGALAAKVFAFAHARDHYQRALTAADYLDADDRRALMPAILCELGYYTMRAGDTRAGRELLVSAIGAAQALDDDAGFVRAARCLTEAAAPASTRDTSIAEFVQRALDISAGDVTEDRVQLLVDLAGLRYFSHDLDHRRELCEEAIELAAAIGDRATAIAATGTWAAIYEPSTVRERLELVSTARAASRLSRSVDQAILAATLEIGTLFEVGRVERGISILEQLQVQSKPLQAPRLKWFMHGWSVVVDVIRGRLDDAEENAHAGLMMWENGTHQDSMAAFGGQMVMVRLLQDRGEELTDLLRSMILSDPKNPAFLAMYALISADTSPDDAHANIGRVLQIIAGGRLRQDALTTTILAFSAEVVARLDDVDPAMAAALADTIEPIAHLHTVVNAYGAGAMYWGSLHHAHGLALAAAGRADEGIAAIERAVAEHDRVGAVLFADRSRAVLAGR